MKPGYIAVDFGCGCHWRVYFLTRTGHMLDGTEFTNKADAIRSAGHLNREAGYTPATTFGQYSGLTN